MATFFWKLLPMSGEASNLGERNLSELADALLVIWMYFLLLFFQLIPKPVETCMLAVAYANYLLNVFSL